MTRAIVVGSGPNGLAAAIRLADAGVAVSVLESAASIGGGMRSGEATLPGLLHDECAAFHPLAVASPYFRTLGLERFGLRYAWAPIEYGHPLDDGRAVLAHRSLDATVAGLGADGWRWRRLLEPIVERFDELAGELLGPLLHVPRHPFALARFGARGARSAKAVARALGGERARALFGGVAAHMLARLDRPMSAAAGVLLAAAAHVGGWPVAVGGSQAIANALVARLAAAGGEVRTSTPVTSFEQVADADVVVLDMMPPAVAELLTGRLAERVERAYRTYRFGPGAFKLDLAVDGGIPWRNPELAAAGTVHLGGTFAEVAAGEADVAAGRMPRRPFVLVGQQAVADPSRAAGEVQPVWAYAHVPARWRGGAAAAIVDQLERFAPGVRDRIIATAARGPAELATHNPNYIGGDIAGGSTSGLQLVMRPRWALNPYRARRGYYVASAATPPGAGVHGMAGFHAAGTVLRDLGLG